MKILVLNCGSSSIKYQLFDMTTDIVLSKGLVDKIGLKGSYLKNTHQNGKKVRLEGEILDHQSGIEYILGVITSKKHGSIEKVNDIEAVGHRVAHGGELFKESAFITDNVINEISKCIELAPLHNPANLKGIIAMSSLIPGINQVAVFDTSFHQTMPNYAYMYAIPHSLYTKYGVRRYGFHGTSYRFVTKLACEKLDLDIKKQKIIACHLGNGASIAAIDCGKSVDTSMGLTPVEGLIMGTRTGDLDLGVFTFIMHKEELGYATANTLINKHSGVLGVSGVSSDMREIEDAAAEGHERAELTLEMYEYRIRKYIGAYTAAMGGLDMLIFTGGIGENADTTRRGVCKKFEYLGLEFDDKINTGLRGKFKVISKESSKVKVVVVPTNEELVIAEDTHNIINSQ